MRDPNTAGVSQYRWYIGGTATWFYAQGVQTVMFTYLVTTVLQAPANQIGLAQTSLTLLSAAFMLLGGAVADRLDRRRLLILLHGLAGLPPLVLVLILWQGALAYEWLIVYGLAIGLVTAFILPAREATLGDVLGPDGHKSLQRAVTTMVGIQFLAQIAGMMLARFAALTGPEAIILSQVVAQCIGLWTAWRLNPLTHERPHDATDEGSQWQRIRAGLSAVRASEALFPVTVLTLSIGVLYIGSFMVVLPVILREEFGGDVGQISTLQISFWGGTIVSSFAIGRIGNIVHRGRLIVGAVATGASVLALLSIKAPLIVLYGLIFIWGLGAGVMISMSRTTLQEHAPAALRARVMSIFQLGFTGGMSIGALLAGVVVEAVGARAATLFPALTMVAILALLVTRSRILQIRAIPLEESPKT
jgi:MFS family permease